MATPWTLPSGHPSQAAEGSKKPKRVPRGQESKPAGDGDGDGETAPGAGGGDTPNSVTTAGANTNEG